MSTFLDTRLSEIQSEEILALVSELEHVTRIGSDAYANSQLFIFLSQCVYPGGTGEKRVPISAEFIAVAPLLDTRVGKLPDGDLRNLCAELAFRNHTALEYYHGNKLSVFLNKTLPKHSAPKKPTSSQQRWNAVAMQRRANR
ncbi:MAG: hypothetical protein WCD79_05955 [Chthoniobacteraceae bacterium]